MTAAKPAVGGDQSRVGCRAGSPGPPEAAWRFRAARPVLTACPASIQALVPPATLVASTPERDRGTRPALRLRPPIGADDVDGPIGRAPRRHGRGPRAAGSATTPGTWASSYSSGLRTSSTYGAVGDEARRAGRHRSRGRPRASFPTRALRGAVARRRRVEPTGRGRPGCRRRPARRGSRCSTVDDLERRRGPGCSDRSPPSNAAARAGRGRAAERPRRAPAGGRRRRAPRRRAPGRDVERGDQAADRRAVDRRQVAGEHHHDRRATRPRSPVRTPPSGPSPGVVVGATASPSAARPVRSPPTQVMSGQPAVAERAGDPSTASGVGGSPTASERLVPRPCAATRRR